MTTPDPGLTAALLKITEHAERLAVLERRVTDNLSQCEMTTAGLSGAVLDLRAVVEQQGTLLESVNDLVKDLLPPARWRRPDAVPDTAVGALVVGQCRTTAVRPSSTSNRGSTTCTGPTTATWP